MGNTISIDSWRFFNLPISLEIARVQPHPLACRQNWNPSCVLYQKDHTFSSPRLCCFMWLKRTPLQGMLILYIVFHYTWLDDVHFRVCFCLSILMCYFEKLYITPHTETHNFIFNNSTKIFMLNHDDFKSSPPQIITYCEWFMSSF